MTDFREGELYREMSDLVTRLGNVTHNSHQAVALATVIMDLPQDKAAKLATVLRGMHTMAELTAGGYKVEHLNTGIGDLSQHG